MEIELTLLILSGESCHQLPDARVASSKQQGRVMFVSVYSVKTQEARLTMNEKRDDFIPSSRIMKGSNFQS